MDALPVVFHCFDETFGLNKFHRPLLQVNVEFLLLFLPVFFFCLFLKKRKVFQLEKVEKREGEHHHCRNHNWVKGAASLSEIFQNVFPRCPREAAERREASCAVITQTSQGALVLHTQRSSWRAESCLALTSRRRSVAPPLPPFQTCGWCQPVGQESVLGNETNLCRLFADFSQTFCIPLKTKGIFLATSWPTWSRTEPSAVMRFDHDAVLGK